MASTSSWHIWERLALMAVDFLAVNLAFYLAWYARYQKELILGVEPANYVDHSVYLPMQISLAVVVVFILALRGLYRFPRSSTALDDAIPLFTASGLALMTVFAGSTFVRYPAESRLTLIFAWVLIPVIDAPCRALYLWALGRLHTFGVGVARTLVVGSNTRAHIIMQALVDRPHLGYSVCGFVDESAEDHWGRFSRLGAPDDLERIIRQYDVSQVIIALPSTSHADIMRIVEHCRRFDVQFRVAPDLYEISLGRLDMDTVSGIPLIGVKAPAIRGLNFALKRAIDALLAALCLLVVGPFVILPLAIAIKIEDHGPIFFGQTRVGRFGSRFTCWKIRSMHQDADEQLTTLLSHNEAEGPIFKMRDDPRCTHVGRFLRRWSLDELPQLWNVLVGDMSLVGPRPATPREVALYEEWHLDRLQGPPGITGLWQVSGRSRLGFSEQVLMDISYIENWSIGLDLRILLRTLPAVLIGKGAF